MSSNIAACVLLCALKAKFHLILWRWTKTVHKTGQHSQNKTQNWISNQFHFLCFFTNFPHFEQSSLKYICMKERCSLCMLLCAQWQNCVFLASYKMPGFHGEYDWIMVKNRLKLLCTSGHHITHQIQDGKSHFYCLKALPFGYSHTLNEFPDLNMNLNKLDAY